MDKVIAYLQDNERRFLDELKEYLGIPTVSAQAAHRSDMVRGARWLADHCRGIGLEAEVCATAGHPVVVARTPVRAGKRPRVMVYGHYDVQPPEPMDGWDSPPFEPRVSGGRLYARGASDNKGQHFAHLKAVEAYLRTGTELPCDLTFVVEGEEEVGSPHLPGLLRERRRQLGCDCVVVSDTGMPALELPALTYALRGITALELKVTGPKRDLHSGIYGGSVANPATVLAQLLAGMVDRNGRVTVAGFYEDVRGLTAMERRQMRRLPHNDAAYRRFLGVPELFGERGYSTEERRTARPTFEINGLTSGYQGEGSKTIVPSWASAKLTFRLVPDQSPAAIAEKVKVHLRQACPPWVRLEMKVGHGAEPYWVSPEGPLAVAAMAALRAGFGREPVMIREGGSIPIVVGFRKILGAESLLLGLALPDANAHSPNECFHLAAFAGGMRMSARLWVELAGKLAGVR